MFIEPNIEKELGLATGPGNPSVIRGWTEWVDGLIQIVKQVDLIHSVPVRAIVGAAHLV